MGRFNVRFWYWLLGGVTLVVCLAGRPAIAHIPNPLPTSQPPPVLVQAAPSLEQQAQTAYDQGQYQVAVELLQQAHLQYQAQGQPLRAAIALSNLSLTHQQLADWTAAEAALIQAWALLENQTAPLGVQAQILDVQGQLQFAQGRFTPALETWRHTAELYGQLNDPQRHVLSRLHQAQALQAQGLFQQVSLTLKDLAAELDNQPDSAMKSTLLRQLGDNLRATGHLDEAEAALQASLAIAQRLQNDPLIAAAALSLGNLEQGRFKMAAERRDRPAALNHARTALLHYQQAAALAEEELGIQARLNLMRLLTDPIAAQWDTAIGFYPVIQQRLSQLPPGRTAIYGYIGLVENLITLKEKSDRADPSWSELAKLLVPAQAQAEALGDIRAQSLVLGTLGHVQEKALQWAAAEDLTHQALALVEPIQADDISYRWHWQLGRIFKAKGQNDAAISAYTDAFNTLEGNRSDEAPANRDNQHTFRRGVRRHLVTANPDVQFAFRQSVEPIYRELVDLLLLPVSDSRDKAQDKSNQAQVRLQQALHVMQALQVVELENFFQACIEQTVDINQVVDEEDPTAAVVYVALLDDRLEVMLKLPKRDNLVHYTAPAKRKAIKHTLSQFRADLARGADVQHHGQELYNWLLKPAVEQNLLSPETIKTLIFVLDGNLRLIPMSILHDGEDYLIKKYALSLSLGLDVRKPKPLLPRRQLQILAAGLTTPPEASYEQLPNVNKELNEIKDTGLSSTLLRDKRFTSKALERQLENTDFNIVHLATHGEFGLDRQDTFILASDGRIDIDTLGQYFQSRRQKETNLEILILSACKTATGDSREVLGIAGATVQAGAKSTIATLWSVDDKASITFAEKLYAQLGRPGYSFKRSS